MRYLLNGEQMRRADWHTIQDLGIPSRTLMERAAAACVIYITENQWPLESVCVVCGSGNNGGDGFAIGRMLCERGSFVTAVFAGNMDHRTEETVWQMERFLEAGGKMETKWPDQSFDTVIDALFGVGLNREIGGSYLQLIDCMNAASGRKLAVDIPSGVSSGSGQILGEAFLADATVTFQECKLGLELYPGKRYAGQIVTADIGIDSSEVCDDAAAAYALEPKDAAALLPERPADAHKGTFGRLLFIAGSKGMSGAAFLNAYAAYRTGAGLVRIFTCEENRVILQQLLPEAIITVYGERPEEALGEVLNWADVICMGSGLGTSEISKQIVNAVLHQAKVPCILDADAINLIAKNPEWKECFKRGDYVLTPHMKELSRFTGLSVNEVIRDRRGVLDRVTSTYPVTLVQKDARTFTGKDGRQTCVNLTGNAAMAKAGSGDVLAGVIGALAAQGRTGYDAAVLGVYLHGLAGDIARNDFGCYSVLARDIADRIGTAIQMTENWKAEIE